jgi:hypothetical protein
MDKQLENMTLKTLGSRLIGRLPLLLVISIVASIGATSLPHISYAATPSCADKAPGFTNYNPITDLSTLNSSPPAGTAYACAAFGGGGYAYYGANDQILGSTLGGPLQTQYAYNASGTPIKTKTSCSGTWSDILNPGACIARSLFAGIASFLIYIGVTFLTACGLLFEFVLQYTVISFKTPMYDSVSVAITSAWGAFRDIANILIIGFFTFIAISTILGSHEYGAKKLLARVLIVAVLINFSLLFTKLIIDSSNFLAYQFYSASLSNIDKGAADATASAKTVGNAINTGIGTSQSQVAGAGIAGTFIRYMGVTGIADSYNKVREKQEESDSALYGLALGVLAFIFLITVGLVFLYGSFLLISRAILFIILLITSSLAFATYLIPALSDKYGWKKWWGSLMSNALLAPVLMMMLWVTLTVSATLKNGLVKNGTLGDLASNTTSTANISALFSYLIILGLLFASFKLASSFSSGIMGFNFAAMIPAFGLGLAAQAAGFLGRQTVGRAGLAVSERLKSASANDKSSMFARRMADFGSQRFKSLATKDFNAMRTGLGASVAGAAGVQLDTIAGKAVKGFEGSQKALADKLAKQADRMTPSTGDAKKAREQAVSKEIERNPDMKDQHRDASSAAAGALTQQKLAEQALKEMHDQHETDMKGLHTVLEEARRSATAGTGSEADITAAQNNIVAARARQVRAIDEQTENIKKAKASVVSAEAARKSIEAAALDRAKATGRFTEPNTSKKATAGDFARNRLTSVLFTDGENERLAKLAEKAEHEHDSYEKLKHSGLLKALKEAQDHDSHDHKPAAAPKPKAEPHVEPAHEKPHEGDGDHGDHSHKH